MTKAEIKLKCLELAIETLPAGYGDPVECAKEYYDFVKPKSWLHKFFNSKYLFGKKTSGSVEPKTGDVV